MSKYKCEQCELEAKRRQDPEPEPELNALNELNEIDITSVGDPSLIELDTKLMKPCFLKTYGNQYFVYTDKDGKKVYAKQIKLSGREVLHKK